MSKQSDAAAKLRAFIAPAFAQLQIPLGESQLTEMTELVGGTMVGAGRFYHTPEHVMHVGSGGDGISVLGAFFHDLVYFQVDQGVSLNVARYIAPFIAEKDSGLVIRDSSELSLSTPVQAVMEVFGFSAGDLLPPASGQNEFLSALTAAAILSAHVGLPDIVQVAACIEATIPFRPGQPTPSENLLARLGQVNEKFSLGLEKDSLSRAVRRAVRLANRDVSNFGGESVAQFLKNTWELVPEINPLLRNPASFTVTGYRQALQKMEAFFSTLDPRTVFHCFEGEPDEGTYRLWVDRAASHIEDARLYFRLKLMSLGMLEALSGMLGKNLGLPVLLGEFSHLGSPEERVDKFLPRLDWTPAKDAGEERLLRLLEDRHEEETGLKSSPLTAFLVRTVGFRPLLKIWPTAEKFFKEQASARDLLEAFPQAAVGHVSDAVAVMLQRRAQRIHTFVGSLASAPPV